MLHGTAAISLLAFLFFNKLPVVKSIQNRVVRIVVRLGVLVVPTYGILYSQISKIQNIKNLTYEQQTHKYHNFLKSGDYMMLNSNISLTDH